MLHDNLKLRHLVAITLKFCLHLAQMAQPSVRVDQVVSDPKSIGHSPHRAARRQINHEIIAMVA
ncbi:hypothetical protein D3C72_2590210 [compost metagenome]